MVDRKKVIQHFEDAIEASGNNNKWRFVRVDILEDAITLLKEHEFDIVYCLDCKHNQTHGCNVLCDLFYDTHNPHGFCDQGEHRDDRP